MERSIKSNRVNYLRVSVTDRCNLRCVYCQTFEDKDFLPRSEILSYEEITKIVSILSLSGVSIVRFTGGEPLVRPQIEKLISMIKEIRSIRSIGMTTNGVLLEEKLNYLKNSGLDTVNISIDSLKRERYKKISGFDYLDRVWGSVVKAISADFKAVKLNTILLKGINDDEVLDFAELTLDNNIYVRFIEYFPTVSDFYTLKYRYVPNKLVKEKIERKFGKLLPVSEFVGNGPAKNYTIRGAAGYIGFINSNTEFFCHNCNRIRLSASGNLYPCLFSSFNINVKEIVRKNENEREIKKLLDEFLLNKGNYTKEKTRRYKFIMSDIGG